MTTNPNPGIGSLVLAVALLATPLLSSDARAFTLIYSSSSNVTTTGWQKNDIAFDIDTSCNSYLDTVNSAMSKAEDLWNHVPSSGLKLSIGATVTLSQAITTYVGSGATAVAPVGNPIVYCDANFQSNSGQPAAQIPGFAGAQNMMASGQMQGGLLVLNFQANAAASLPTLGADSSSIVLAHEIGHILGLGHSASDVALMYFQTGPTRKLILSQDDVNAISYLYPRSEPGTGGMLGCGTVSAIGSGRGQGRGGASGPGAAGELALLFAAALVGVSALKRGRALATFSVSRQY